MKETLIQHLKGYKVLGRVSMDNLSLNTDDEEVCIFDDVQALAKSMIQSLMKSLQL